MGKGELSDLERTRLGSDLYQHPLRPQVIAMNPADGMPQPASNLSMQDTLAPTLDPDTFVCMADESRWVVDVSNHAGTLETDTNWFELDQAELERVLEGRDGQRSIAVSDLTEEHRAGLLGYLRRFGERGTRFCVEPIRPQCAFYRRVMTDFEGQAEIKAVERACTAQRTEGGEFIALRDTRVYACEHRAPRDFVSERRLRDFDARRIAEGKRVEEEFDVEGQLAALKAAPTGENNG